MKKTGDGKKSAPSLPPFVKVSFSIPFSLLSLFDEESERRGYTRSEAIRQGIRHQLEMWTGRRL